MKLVHMLSLALQVMSAVLVERVVPLTKVVTAEGGIAML